jgi:hypothetical protein
MARFALGLCLVLAACVTNNDDPGEDPFDPPPTGDIEPEAGIWSYSDTPISNSCPGNVNVGEAGSFAIEAVTSTGFRIVPNDGTDPFDCTLDDGEFDCPDRVKDVEDLRPTVDAVITVRARANGQFSSETFGAGEQSADATCEGTQCNAAGNVFPCSASVSFTIRAQ